MIISVFRIVVFAAIVLAGIWGLNMLLSTPGELRIVFGEREYFFTPIAGVGLFLAVAFGLWLLVKLLGLIVATGRFIAGDETALSRFFNRSRERRGMEALTEAILAVSQHDPKAAVKMSAKAERLLRRPQLTRLVRAQAAELAGDERTARTYYKAMALEQSTSIVGIKGLMAQAIEKGDNGRALALAERAHTIDPREPEVLEALYTLQSQEFDWAGARQTLTEQRKAHTLDKAEADRREAALALAQAGDAIEAGETEHARKLAIEAAKLDPANAEAAATACRSLVEAGSTRAASKIVIEAWRARPSPDLAKAFAEIEPDEAPRARRERFDRLFEVNNTHAEAHYLRAELAMTDGDFVGARRALDRLNEAEPSARTCAMMAAIARGEGEEERIVRGWLARALGAPRGPEDESAITQAAMLPLLVEGPEAGGSNVAQDAEIADSDEAPSEKPAATA